MVNICKVEECEKRVHGNGYCGKHYMRIRLHGTIDIPFTGQSRPGKVNGMYGSKRIGKDNPFFGKNHHIDTIQKNRQAHLGKESSFKGKKSSYGGSKHWNWKGGVTPDNLLIRQSFEYKEWRKAVFQRDNYTCLNCMDNTGGNLHADHIKPFSLYPDLRFELSNGRTLCRGCHAKLGWLPKRESIMIGTN